jgi:hypothetical protein
MGVLIGGLVMIGALSLFNLALGLRMARQMRSYAQIFGTLQPAEVDAGTRPIGSAVGRFATVAIDGTPVDDAWFIAPTLVGFFSPGCSACGELIPGFVAAAATHRALAVVESGPESMDDYVSSLSGSAVVVSGEQAQPVVAAFGVHGFPAACIVDGHGVITATGVHLVKGHQTAVPA